MKWRTPLIRIVVGGVTDADRGSSRIVSWERERIRRRRRLLQKGLGFTLLELMAALAIIGVLAMLGWTRMTGGQSDSKKAACEAHQGNIEIQAELWRHNTGGWPAANLSNIGGNVNYFPEGLPICPVDGTAYTIDSTGRVVGHSH